MSRTLVVILVLDVAFSVYVVSRLFAAPATLPISAERIFR